jgi:hypothetical protein
MVDWDACLALAEAQRLSGTLLRMVESQEQVATNRLVSSLARQSLLEEMLDATKPPIPAGAAANLHYLLATPFRYPPLKWGSRFGKRTEPSLFYGSVASTTLLYETAYYRFVFWTGMLTPPQRKLDTQHTMLAAEYQTARGLRLQRAPFIVHRAALTSPSDYQASQALGAKMRLAGIQAFEYMSARDPAGGTNVALYTPAAFAKPAPVSQEGWLCETTGEQVRFRAAHGAEVHDIRITTLLVDGKLPLPA